MFVLYSNSRIFVILVYILNGRKQTLVDMIGILSVLRMHGLHDKRHLLAKLRICGSENYRSAHGCAGARYMCMLILVHRLNLIHRF